MLVGLYRAPFQARTTRLLCNWIHISPTVYEDDVVISESTCKKAHRIHFSISLSPGGELE